MSHAALEILSGGIGVSIQDAGRTGYRSIGVPVSGALDPRLLAAANGLAGNAPDVAGLELRLVATALKAVGGPLRVALAGDVSARLLAASGDGRAVAAWSSVTLFDGDVLQIGRPRGTAYLAVAGGIRTPEMLGSRSTYARAGLGQSLAPGCRLPCAVFTGDLERDWRAAGPLFHASGPIRVMPGPQLDHFSAAAREAFFGAAFVVTPAHDRMGLRLAGPQLQHLEGGADIVSDGVTPGAIQVPADGQPIVLLADCQTVGGYPKIATVIRADLPRLAHVEAGDLLRFCCVDAAEATAARRALSRGLADWLAALQPAGTLDTASLLCANLAGAAVRGDEP